MLCIPSHLIYGKMESPFFQNTLQEFCLHEDLTFSYAVLTTLSTLHFDHGLTSDVHLLRIY